MKYDMDYMKIRKLLEEGKKYIFSITYNKTDYSCTILGMDKSVVVSFINESFKYGVTKMLTECKQYIRLIVLNPSEYSLALYKAINEMSTLKDLLVSDSIMESVYGSLVIDRISLTKKDLEYTKEKSINKDYISYKELSEKSKKGYKYYDTNTDDKLSNNFKSKGVLNYELHQVIYDKTLLETYDLERSIEECKKNVFYFFKRVLKHDLTEYEVLLLFLYSLDFSITVHEYDNMISRDINNLISNLMIYDHLFGNNNLYGISYSNLTDNCVSIIPTISKYVKDISKLKEYISKYTLKYEWHNYTAKLKFDQSMKIEKYIMNHHLVKNKCMKYKIEQLYGLFDVPYDEILKLFPNKEIYITI
jgi:hypothetical protein